MITSTSNDRVKRVRALQQKHRTRHKAGQFVLEGATLVRDILKTETAVDEIYYTEAFADSEEGIALLGELSMSGGTSIAVSEQVMQAMSDMKTSQGILTVAPIPKLPPPENPDFALIIDGISNPGNMGTIMRAAAAAGVPLMVATTGTVDLTNPKVVRSAMGAHFRLPVRYLSWEGIANHFSEHVILMAESGGGAPYFKFDWSQPCALILSDEAHGPGEEARRTAHARVTIPMPGDMESLNVAMAGSILLFEMVRQRATAD